MPIEIKSSARVTSPWSKVILFGPPNSGKTMSLVTAPKPVWLLTEATCDASLQLANIEAVHGSKPTQKDIVEWLKEDEPKLKGDALTSRVKEIEVDLSIMTGITYDVPRLDAFNSALIGEAITFLESPAAASFQTVFVDSGSVFSKIILDAYLEKNKDPRRAYGQAAKEALAYIQRLFKLPKHIVFSAHAANNPINMGTKDEPVLIDRWQPSFEGNVLKREIPHMVRDIYRACQGLDDAGNPRYYFQTKAENSNGCERTLCVKLPAQAEPNWTEIFSLLRAA